MPIYKILIPLLAGIMIWRALWLFIRKESGLREIIFSVSFWGFFCFIALFPGSITIFAKITGIQDSVQAFFASIIMFMSFVILRMIIMMENTNRDITKIVRYKALEEFKEKQKKISTIEKYI